MRLRRWLCLLAMWSCACKHQPLPAASVQPGQGDLLFLGTCDASGAVPLGGLRFAVADDEVGSPGTELEFAL